MATPSTPATLMTGKLGEDVVAVVVVVLVDGVVTSNIVVAVVEGSNCGKIGKG